MGHGGAEGAGGRGAWHTVQQDVGFVEPLTFVIFSLRPSPAQARMNRSVASKVSSDAASINRHSLFFTVMRGLLMCRTQNEGMPEPNCCDNSDYLRALPR